MQTTLAAFDTLASCYDELWTRSAVGRSQRASVWRETDQLFRAGDCVLDLGCGTGEDALRLAGLGIRVHAVDKSKEMVRIALERGVRASVLPIERICELSDAYDGVLSNFGALNCISDIEALTPVLAKLVRRGGHVAICLIGNFCAWETLWYLFHGRPNKAVRRWTGRSFSSSLGIQVFYPSAKQVIQAFQPNFGLLSWKGIGLFVPPSYVGGVNNRTVLRLERIDRHLSHLPLLRAASDHRLFIFVRR